jgi:hypothetical protein
LAAVLNEVAEWAAAMQSGVALGWEYFELDAPFRLESVSESELL